MNLEKNLLQDDMQTDTNCAPFIKNSKNGKWSPVMESSSAVPRAQVRNGKGQGKGPLRATKELLRGMGALAT